MVLCFSDPNQKVPDEDVANIFRLCDQNNIPYASNVATAEMLVLGLARGDLASARHCQSQNQTLYRLTSGPECHKIGRTDRHKGDRSTFTPTGTREARHRLKARPGRRSEDSPPAGMETSTARSP